MELDLGKLKDLIRDIPDFPKPGIGYKDITPLLADQHGFALTVDAIAGHYANRPIDKVVGIEARGFIVAAPVAYRLSAGFVPVRKAGKLPAKLEREEYELEYGTDLLEIHHDGVHPEERVLIIDDVLATGGTAAATARLVERLGGVVVGLGFIIELALLEGRRKLLGRELCSLLTYE